MLSSYFSRVVIRIAIVVMRVSIYIQVRIKTNPHPKTRREFLRCSPPLVRVLEFDGLSRIQIFKLFALQCDRLTTCRLFAQADRLLSFAGTIVVAHVFYDGLKRNVSFKLGSLLDSEVKRLYRQIDMGFDVGFFVVAPPCEKQYTDG